jgi:hypothetical protein
MAFEACVDWHQNSTNKLRTKRCENPFGTIGRPNRNSVTMFKALRNEGARSRFDFVDDFNERPTT